MPYEKKDNQNYHQSKYGNGNRDYQPKGQWQKPQGQEQEGNKPTRQKVFLDKVEADVNSVRQQEIDKEFETFSRSFAGKGLNKDWFNEVIEHRNNLMEQQKDYEAGKTKYSVSPNMIQGIFDEYATKAQEPEYKAKPREPRESKPQGQEQEGNKPTRSSGYERLEAKIEEQSAQISHLVGLVERLTNQLLDNQNTKTNTKEQYNELKAEIAEENDNAMRHHR